MRITWKDTTARVYLDGAEQGVLRITSLDYTDEITPETAHYMGDADPTKDGHYAGGRGTVEMRFEKGSPDPREIYENHKEGIRLRLNRGRVNMVVTSPSTTGSEQMGYRFENMILNQSLRGGEQTSWAATWSFECNSVLPV